MNQCKMATASNVVVCDVLCFLRCKFGITAVKIMKSLLIEFYDVEVFSYAKNQLLDDISSMNLTIKMPHIPRRRDGDDRIFREFDDIYTLFSVLDEHKLLGGIFLDMWRKVMTPCLLRAYMNGT